MGIVCAIWLITACQSQNEKLADQCPELPQEFKDSFSSKSLLYGISTDSFEVFTSLIKRNQFLADILLKYGVDYFRIDELAKSSKPVFDIRKMRAGNSYTIFYHNDSLLKADYFVYERNDIDYVVFDLRDSIQIYLESKPVSFNTKTVSGTINNSLYLCLTEQDVSPLLALQLGDIYAWSIDFYRINKGDQFKAIYRERVVDGEVVGVEDVLSAWFRHSKSDFYAIPFTQDGQLDFFDENAQSLRKAFLKAPLKFSRISSSFSHRRFHPVQKRYKAHLGVDYAAPSGTPIMATGDGIISEATYKKYNGRYVKIRHNSTYSTQYLHMSKIAAGIKPGVKVRQGQTIGYVGSTGLATGPHVCYRFWKNGSQVNSLKVKVPPSKPIKAEYLEEYNMVKDSIISVLDAIPMRTEQLSGLE